MKKLIFLIYILFSAINTKAQNKADKPNQYNDYFNIVKELNAGKASSNEQRKTRAVKQRVIHDSLFKTIGAQHSLVTTRDYNYSGGRGAAFTQNNNPHLFQNNFNSDEYYETSFPANGKSKILKQYDANDNVIYEITLFFNPNTVLWDTINIYKNFQYQNNLITSRERWTNANDKQDKDEYAYDANNNLILLTNSVWDAQNNSWTPVRKMSYSYNGFNKCTEYLIETWNLNTNSWENYYRYLFIYNANNYAISRKDEAYIVANWQPRGDVYFFYDANNRLEYAHVFAFHIPSVEYDSYYKYTYQGNNTYHETETRYVYSNILLDTIEDHKIDYTFDANGNVLSRNVTLWKMNAWSDTSYLNKYYYEDYTSWPVSVDDDLNIQNVSLYPNPVTSNTYISFPTSHADESSIQIIDLTGNILYKTKENGYIGDHLVKLPVSNLARGTYMVNVQVRNRNIVSLKLLKE